jgi:3-dehydro-L-gulonate 2-dehydrogenase
MKISYQELYDTLKDVLMREGFPEEKASVCANIFAINSRDGVHSHGINRFPVFIERVREGLVDMHAEPAMVNAIGMMEQWDGHLAPGMYSATICMKRAIELAKANGLGCVALRNTNHWMRGGTYGWQAAEQGCIAICSSNTIANMPAWGGTTPTIGNNPLVIAVPRPGGHVVLDMAMSQFSYGKLQEYEMNEKLLPVNGGFDENGLLTRDPGAIRVSRRSLPIGYWKGSGLSIMLDMLAAGLSGGKSVAQITKDGPEYAMSQFFLCFDAKSIDNNTLEEIIAFTREHDGSDAGSAVRYPGEQTLANRIKSESEGILVNEKIWRDVKGL